jgi:hypothetical protein
MIKVKNIKTHTQHTVDINSRKIDVQVTDAELVLVECKRHPMEGELYRCDHEKSGVRMFWVGQNTYGGATINPIFISKTEKIEVGDWVYDRAGHQKVYIKEFDALAVDGGNCSDWCVKILALPDHFSPKQLQDIVDGKLKDGKYLLECDPLFESLFNGVNPPAFIKLNPHIIIHPVERMYTLDEMIKHAFNFYSDMSLKMKVPFNLISENRDNAKFWFENHVK